MKEDRGTPELQAKKGIHTVKGNDGVKRSRVRSESYIDELLNRSLIDQRQWAAADRVYHLWYNGVQSLQATGVANYEKLIVDCAHQTDGFYQTEFQQQCRDAYRQAVRYLEPEGQKILVAVCCHNLTAVDVEKSMGFNKRYVIPRLQSVLNTLADFYKIR